MPGIAVHSCLGCQNAQGYDGKDCAGQMSQAADRLAKNVVHENDINFLLNGRVRYGFPV